MQKRRNAILIGLLVATNAFGAQAATVTPGSDVTSLDYGPAGLDSDYKLKQSQGRETTTTYPAGTTSTHRGGDSVTTTYADYCGNVANGIPCLDGNGDIPASALPPPLCITSDGGFDVGTSGCPALSPRTLVYLVPYGLNDTRALLVQGDANRAQNIVEWWQGLGGRVGYISPSGSVVVGNTTLHSNGMSILGGLGRIDFGNGQVLEDNGGGGLNMGSTYSLSFNADQLGTQATGVINFNINGVSALGINHDKSATFYNGLKLNGATSGAFTISPPATVTSYTLTPPAAAATAAGQVWASTGVNATMQWVTPLTNASPFTIDGATTDLICGQLSDFSTMAGCSLSGAPSSSNYAIAFSSTSAFVGNSSMTLARLYGGGTTFDVASTGATVAGGKPIIAGNIDSSGNTTGAAALSLPLETPIAAAGGDYAFAYRTGSNTATDTTTGTATSCPLNRACTMVRTSTTTATATVTNTINGYAISGNPVLGYSDVGAVSTSRTVSTSNGLQGGGALSSNLTLSPVYGSTANTVMQGNDSRVTGAANQQLSNLSSVAFNASLIPDTANVRDVGSSAKPLNKLHTTSLAVGGVDATPVPTANAPVIADASGTVKAWAPGLLQGYALNSNASGVDGVTGSWTTVTTASFTTTAASSIVMIDANAVVGLVTGSTTHCGIRVASGSTQIGVAAWESTESMSSFWTLPVNTLWVVGAGSYTVALQISAMGSSGQCNTQGGSGSHHLRIMQFSSP